MRDDMSEHEQKILERAYQLWEEAGRPEGRDEEFWRKAQDEIAAENIDDDSDGTTRAVPRRK
jgi:predicted subunit of tRNA(5-methylaminomethyl-2-thiouridylate) methyltransferase